MKSIMEKRARIYAERAQRLVARGVLKEHVEEVLAREDYERLTPEKKMARLETIVAGAQEGFARDVQALHHNQSVLLETMDVNFTAFEMVLRDLGVTPEKQKEYVDTAIQVVGAKKKAKLDADQAEKAKALEAVEKQTVAEQASPAGEPEPAPTEATVFGG